MKSGIDPKPYFSHIQKILVFRNLSAEAAAWLMDKAEFLSFEPREVIVAEGDLSPSFFSVIAGTVYVSVEREGQEVYFNTLGEGEIFGEAAMFLKAPRTASVIAADDAVLMKVTRFDLTEFLKIFPHEGNKFLLAVIYSILQKLRTTNQELAYERQVDAKQDDVDSLVAEMLG